ncbi:hypothetical protein D3C81_2185960 [compost metagenome]
MRTVLLHTADDQNSPPALLGHVGLVGANQVQRGLQVYLNLGAEFFIGDFIPWPPDLDAGIQHENVHISRLAV